MKIVYCTDSICHPGGIQMVTIAKANALAKIPSNEVYIVVTDNKSKPLKPLGGVHVVDLGVNYYADDWRGFIYVLKGIFLKRRLHKRLLREKLNEIKPDVVISTGTSEKYFLPTLRVCSHPRFVREIHFYTGYRHVHATTLRDKLMSYIGDWYDYKWKIKAYDRIVVLTNEDRKKNWRDNAKVVVMPNPITTECGRLSNIEAKKAISMGRLVHVKNFSSLIRIWSEVAKKHPDWRLEIYGSGEQEAMLQLLIKSLGLEDKVLMMGYTSEALERMADASMYCLSSITEGFPLVLVEAMSVGLPVVSYACPTGPSDIIVDEDNGYLIPVGNEKMFADRICTLIEDKERRIRLGHKAKEMSEAYRVDVICTKWMQLFEELRKGKR